MTDISKYKNVSLSKETYDKIDNIRKVIVPQMTISRSQTITLLVNEKVKSLNGKVNPTKKKVTRKRR
ncbi:MAG: hypothetical protein VW810_00160 [Pelagibacteraceae bacterium]